MHLLLLAAPFLGLDLRPEATQDPARLDTDFLSVEEVLEDWPKSNERFRLIYVLDGRGSQDADHPMMLEASQALRETWGEDLEVTEIVLTGDPPLDTYREIEGHHTYFVRIEDGRLPEEWAPAQRGRTWLFGPGQLPLGHYALDQTAELQLRIQQCIPHWRGKKPDAIWDDVLEAGACWRYAMRAIHAGSARPTGVIGRPLRIEAAFGARPGEDAAASAAVQLASALLLAVHQGTELPDPLLGPIRSAPLFEESEHVRLAELFYRLYTGEVDGKQFQKELLPRNKRDHLDAVAALYQLQLRDPHLVEPLWDLATRRATPWDVRSLALRCLAAQVEPGIRFTPPRSLPAKLLPRANLVLKERTWQARLAYVEYLGAFEARGALELLLELLAAEEHPRVLDGVALALERLSGMRFRRNLEAWRRWWASIPEDWEPDLGLTEGWRPPAPPLGYGGADRTRVTVGEGELFATDVARVVFAIDVSDSMRDGLAREVGQHLGAKLEAIGETEIGLVLFNDRALIGGLGRQRLQRVDREQGQELLRRYRTTTKEGRTNLADGLRVAFAYEDAEEIFLVTDAFPTAGQPRTTAGLVALVDELNLTRRCRVSTVLLRVGRGYYSEDIRSHVAPEPTPAQRADWAQRAAQYVDTQDFSLLHELARHNDGRCRMAFGTQIYSRNGRASDDQDDDR